MTNSVSATKAELRNQTLAKRNALSTEERIEKSLAAAERAKTCSALIEAASNGAVISGFHPIRSEIDPRPLMAELATMGARLALPVVIDKTTIIFRELVRGAPMIDTGFGTMGPDETAAVLDPEVLIMPLSVFDAQGGRIGYGAGHYDRAIEKLINKGISPVLIGMAFQLQQIDEVPVEPHDQPLAAIITESEVMATCASGNLKGGAV